MSGSLQHPTFVVPQRPTMRSFILLAALLLFGRAGAQVCDPIGNLYVLSNYNGGIVTINVNVDIPDLVIGISTYEPVQVFITGPFAANVTQVLYAGMNSNQNNDNCGQGNFSTTITGVDPGIVTINPPMTPPTVGFTPAHGNGTGPFGGPVIGAGGACDTTISAGGVNTPDELVYHFEEQTGATLWAHQTQYDCWQNDIISLTDGGNCCIDPTPTADECDPLGNLMIYSNYDGGDMTINVDQNIPNLKIGICTYETVSVNFVGPFVGNITEVIYAGFGGYNNNCGINPFVTTITGVDPSIITSFNQSQGTTAIANYLGEPLGPGLPPLVNCISGAQGDCSTTTSNGNSAPQIVQFFLDQFGPGTTLYGHQVQYDCFFGTFNLSDGGNCCLQETGTPLNPIYVDGAIYDFIPWTDSLLCGGPITIDLSFYPVIIQPPSYPGYVWSDGTLGPVITITEPGTYSFIVGDYCHYADGLWLTDTVVVSPCCAFGGVDSTITPISCTGGADGSITVDPVQAGTFTYTWNTVPPAATPTIDELAAGTYVVEIDNGANCDTTVTFTLVDPPPVEMEVTGDADICIGESTTLTAVWLGTTGTVDVDWGPLGTGNDLIISPADTTTVTATITDDLGCSATYDFVVNPVVCCPTYTIDATLTDPLCTGTSDGSIAVAVATTNTFTYAWNTTPAQTSETATDLAAGSYSVTITDDQACDTVLTYTLTDPPVLSVTVNGITPLCQAVTATFTAEAEGGTGPYTYAWTPEATGPSTSFTTTTDATVSTIATDANGCTAEGSFTLVVTPAPTVTFTTSADTVCAQADVRFFAVGDPSLTLLWDLGDAGASSLPNPTASYEFAGPQEIFLVGTTPDGCASLPVTRTITIAPLPSVSLTAEQDGCGRGITVIALSDIEAELTLALDSLPLPVASSVNRYAVDPGEYTVHLLATTAVGCQDSTEVDVLVEDPLGIYLPNTFTPDNNGINDAFGLPTLEDPRIYELLVFDRWGAELFRSNTPTDLWTASGIPDGVYPYILRTEDPCQPTEVLELRGHVTVLR